MNNLIDLIKKNEDWLVRRVLEYAHVSGYGSRSPLQKNNSVNSLHRIFCTPEGVAHICTPEKDWQHCIAALSDSLIQSIGEYGKEILHASLFPDDDFQSDPMSAFGISETRRHRERGVSLAVFMGLMKYFRQSYIDLLFWKASEPNFIIRGNTSEVFYTYRLIIERWFDRTEIACCREWVKQSPLSCSQTQFGNEELFFNHYAPMLLIDPETADIKAANPAACFYYGYTQEELTKMKISDINMLSKEQVFHEMTQAKAENRSYFLFRHRLANGEVRDVEVWSSPIRVHGKARLYSIIHDVTERKEVEKSYQTLAENLPGMVYRLYLKEKNQMKFFNNMVETMTGYGAEELKEGEICSIEPLILPEDQPAIYRTVKDAIAEKKPFEVGYRIQDKNGEIRYFLERGRPIYGSDGQPSYIDGVILDQTERKKAEESLKESERRLRGAVLDAPFPIMIHAEDGEVILISKRWTELTGYGHEEIPKITDWVYKAYGKKIGLTPSVITKLYGIKKRVNEGEFEVTTIFGDKKTWEFSSSPLGRLPDGRRAVISMAVDMTERKKAETALHHAREAAEAASQAKSRFLSTMSHEIRTPLNAIIGMADAFSETLLTLEQQSFIKVFRTAGEDLLAIINDILDISKIEAGHLELEQVVFNLAEVVKKTCDILSAKARKKGLDLIACTPPDASLSLIGDPYRLRQILMNLIGNAIKFTDQGKVRVEVRGEGAEVTNSEPRTLKIFFSITDTGIGIPEDKIKDIFENFIQADSSVTRKYGGTGLGLAISKRLVEMMGGNIRVNSTPGKGSCFEFTMEFAVVAPSLISPRKPCTPVAREPYSPDHAGVQGSLVPSVLLVEDSKYNQIVVKTYLKNSKINLDIAENGLTAVEKFKIGKYDLVLMDVQMPVMDGLTATCKIRELEKAVQSSSPVPIIAMTAYALEEDMNKSLVAGCNEHLSKPVNKKNFIETITKYLGDINIKDITEKEGVSESKISQHPEDKQKEPIVIHTDPALKAFVPDFLNELKQKVGLLKKYLRENNFENIRSIGHRMKGEGGTYGFNEVTELGARIQIAAQQEDSVKIRQLSEELSRHLDRIILK